MHTLIISRLQCHSGSTIEAVMPNKDNPNTRSKAESIYASFEQNMARDLLEIKRVTYALIRKTLR
ncbi:MAG: hypothetical protein QOJ15_4929 [Bradyrhizobium sp.]|jgi:hypothetical protein|nr:hypothetical protein [Bradyrhizobium sp.]